MAKINVLYLVTSFMFMGMFIIEGVNCRKPNHWRSGHATYYGANQAPSTLGGACGFENTIHAGFGVHTTALSGAMFKGGEACGACYLVKCDFRADPKWCLRGATITVTATNFCPPNNQGGWCDPPRHHFDMAMPSFFRIARRSNEGIVPILYKRVSCRRRGGVRFTMRGQGNFNMVMIANVGGNGGVRSVSVRSSKTKRWVAMSRNWGVNWQSYNDLRNQKLSFKLTLNDGKTMTFYNVVPSTWSFGQTFSSPNQFI
ncbi:hypothetical protein RND81_12G233100 [Saponaria officinalis]|uniref:Expansin n=1 Tax=Saponaria officinalis TaxID=3572 RepID=A0AAW1HES5_SAPOF